MAAPGPRQGAAPVRLTHRAHQRWREVLRRGDLAVDLTCGRGHDSLAMARMLGEGRLVCVDVQRDAIESTRAAMRAGAPAGVRVDFYRGDHAAWLRGPAAAAAGPAALAAFNLGYLPGSDKRVITRAPSTLEALALLTGTAAGAPREPAIRVGGLISILAYAGHEGGREELEAVEGAVRGARGGVRAAAARAPAAPRTIGIDREAPLHPQASPPTGSPRRTGS